MFFNGSPRKGWNTAKIFIEKTGHTYQQKHREVAGTITRLVLGWRGKDIQ